MNDTELRNVALAYAIEQSKLTGNPTAILATATEYFNFLKGTNT